MALIVSFECEPASLPVEVNWSLVGRLPLLQSQQPRASSNGPSVGCTPEKPSPAASEVRAESRAPAGPGLRPHTTRPLHAGRLLFAVKTLLGAACGPSGTLVEMFLLFPSPTSRGNPLVSASKAVMAGVGSATWPAHPRGCILEKSLLVALVFRDLSCWPQRLASHPRPHSWTCSLLHLFFRLPPELHDRVQGELCWACGAVGCRGGSRACVVGGQQGHQGTKNRAGL